MPVSWATAKGRKSIELIAPIVSEGDEVASCDFFFGAQAAKIKTKRSKGRNLPSRKRRCGKPKPEHIGAASVFLVIIAGKCLFTMGKCTKKFEETTASAGLSVLKPDASASYLRLRSPNSRPSRQRPSSAKAKVRKPESERPLRAESDRDCR